MKLAPNWDHREAQKTRNEMKRDQEFKVFLFVSGQSLFRPEEKSFFLIGTLLGLRVFLQQDIDESDEIWPPKVPRSLQLKKKKLLRKISGANKNLFRAQKLDLSHTCALTHARPHTHSHIPSLPPSKFQSHMPSFHLPLSLPPTYALSLPPS